MPSPQTDVDEEVAALYKRWCEGDVNEVGTELFDLVKRLQAEVRAAQEASKYFQDVCEAWKKVEKRLEADLAAAREFIAVAIYRARTEQDRG